MTWSQRQFLEIQLLPSVVQSQQQSKYRLYKFMDQRDSRHDTYRMSSTLTLEEDSWCQHTTIPVVLYIPGHGGSYEQSRSLGAHGTQLTKRYYSTQETRVQQQQRKHNTRALRQNLTIPYLFPDNINDFYYDVYAIDFNNEGGGFHGAILQRQAAFIADVVSTLTTTCHLDQLHIVAHSIGGISVRLALTTHAQSMPKTVRTVVTLGTPHAYPVLTWEPTMLNMYHNLLQQPANDNDPVIVSISGGLRDEMIPPMACCFVGHDNRKRRWSLLATNIMHPATIEGIDSPPTLGMDHCASVWCHNLLSQVRNILYVLIRADSMKNETRTVLLQQWLREQGKDASGLSDNYYEATGKLHTVLMVREVLFFAANAIRRVDFGDVSNTLFNLRVAFCFSIKMFCIVFHK